MHSNNIYCDINSTNETKSRVEELYEIYKNAIVTIISEYSKKGKCPQVFTGSGFIIEYCGELYVITNAHVVLRSTVVDPMTSIYCGINGVNGKKIRLVYRLCLVGVDATADVAVLRIIDDLQKEFPQFGCHPAIKFGNELRTPIGAKIFNISNPLGKDTQSFTIGYVRDNAWFDNTGNIIVSCITTSLLVYPSSSGSPVLDADTGRCLGIVSFGFTDSSDVNNIGFAVGCGASMMKIILSNILNNKNVACITADCKNYVTNLKGFLGNIAYVGNNAATISTLFTDNFANLKIEGILITQVDPYGPLARPIKGEKINVGDVIDDDICSNTGYDNICSNTIDDNTFTDYLFSLQLLKHI